MEQGNFNVIETTNSWLIIHFKQNQLEIKPEFTTKTRD